ncbi:hypothetical protein KSX_19480 [Ktedonospora formicarum]|uniref:Uncharacterized protein n=1 Tax=Ktedonospora formicarum TaxID=2778364 RepID=A0A8J3HZ47_9CHLR|nr:hypothetical protein KSX_19480 [Ktedonospora formicarum]
MQEGYYNTQNCANKKSSRKKKGASLRIHAEDDKTYRNETGGAHSESARYRSAEG